MRFDEGSTERSYIYLRVRNPPRTSASEACDRTSRLWPSVNGKFQFGLSKQIAIALLTSTTAKCVPSQCFNAGGLPCIPTVVAVRLFQGAICTSTVAGRTSHLALRCLASSGVPECRVRLCTVLFRRGNPEQEYFTGPPRTEAQSKFVKREREIKFEGSQRER